MFRWSACVQAALVEYHIEGAIVQVHAGRIHDEPLQLWAVFVPGFGYARVARIAQVPGRVAHSTHASSRPLHLDRLRTRAGRAPRAARAGAQPTRAAKRCAPCEPTGPCDARMRAHTRSPCIPARCKIYLQTARQDSHGRDGDCHSCCSLTSTPTTKCPQHRHHASMVVVSMNRAVGARAALHCSGCYYRGAHSAGPRQRIIP